MARLFERSLALLKERVAGIKNPNEFSFVFMGDSWAGDGQASNAIFKEALKVASSFRPLLIFHSGDAVFTGSVEEIKTGRPNVSSFLDLVDNFAIDPDTKTKIPFFVVPGNHEENGFNGDFQNFEKYVGPFHFQVNIPKLKFTLIGLKSVFRIKTNGKFTTKYGLTAAERGILRKYMSTRQKYTFVGMHTPPRVGKWANKNYFQDEDATFIYGLKEFLTIIRHKVSKVLLGHVHAYDQEVFEGTEYIISGGTGAPLIRRGFLSKKSPVAQETFHIVLVKIKNGRVTHKVIPIGWTT